MNELGNLYFSYQNKYPECPKDKIIDMMLDDGVIDFESADQIRKGVALFDYYKTKKTEGEIKFQEIFGLQLSKDVTLNQEIEPTKQPMTQGDCWLLSDINSLSYTDWGKQAIREAIIPDEDGNGVTIRFKGSPLENKDIHITKEQIIEARNSGNYSSGDDDMIAFELATENTFRQMVKQGLATRCETDDAMRYKGAKYRSYVWLGVETEDFDQFPISKLLGINVFEFDKFNAEEIPGIEEHIKNVLKFLSNHQNSIAANCGFSFLFGGWGDKNSKDYIHGGHAYAIKSINYGKDVIVTDPHYSDYEIKVPWKVFTESFGRLDISCKDDKTEKELISLVPKDFNEQIKKSKENWKLQIEEDRKAMKAYSDSLILEMHKEDSIREERWRENMEQKRLIEKQNEPAEIVQTIREAMDTDNYKELLFNYKINSNTIMTILDEFPDLILWMDKITYGWGNGSNKNLLMLPIIDALADKANELNIDSSKITNFKKKCVKEVNAIFYTNEKVVQQEVENMLNLIKTQEQQ